MSDYGETIEYEEDYYTYGGIVLGLPTNPSSGRTGVVVVDLGPTGEIEMSLTKTGAIT